MGTLNGTTLNPTDLFSNNNINLPSYNVFVGEIYVPHFEGAWNEGTKPYESLAVVTYDAVEYTAKCDVPEGVQITNTDYWQKGNGFNQQYANLEKTVEQNIQEIHNEFTKFQEKEEGFFNDSMLKYGTQLQNYVDEKQGYFDEATIQMKALQKQVTDLVSPILQEYQCNNLLGTFTLPKEGTPIIQVLYVEVGAGLGDNNETLSGFSTSTSNLLKANVEYATPTLINVYVPDNISIPNKKINKISDTKYSIYDSTLETKHSCVVNIIYFD